MWLEITLTMVAMAMIVKTKGKTTIYRNETLQPTKY
jgi:hypothetical protein